MLQTINGFDLMLIIIITGLLINVYRLNRECESYVEQVLRLSWDLQEEIQANETFKHDHENQYCACESCIPF